MGRIQSSIGLITGTDIAGTVDQLIAISARPRDRVQSRNATLEAQQAAINELTASVIGVQLSGNRLGSSSLFRSNKTDSSNSDALSATAGQQAAIGEYQVRTLQTAATHAVSSSQTFSATDTALNLSGTIAVNPNGFAGDSALLSTLNNGLGVQSGTIRITDRSGSSAEIDLSKARTIDDVLQAINDADIEVRASTTGTALELTDTSGSTSSNLIVEQLGTAETAADLGLFGIDVAANSATGVDLELSNGATSLRGAELSELAGGGGIGPLTNLDITLSDASSASVDLSSASNLAEVVDLINESGLAVIARLNDAENGLRIRDVSGGGGNFIISSTDDTAADLGVVANTGDTIVVGSNLYKQTVDRDTLLSALNQGTGPTSGSFTVTDSDGVVGAINLTSDSIEDVGDLIDAINALATDVTASLNETGDGIAIVDNAAGSGTLTIADTGSGTVAESLGIAGTATTQTFGGSPVSVILGTEADSVEVTATDTLDDIVAKLNATGRYGEASTQLNDDGSYSLKIRSLKGGEEGRIAINADGLGLFLRTEQKGRDAVIAVSSDSASERFLTSTDGVFEIDNDLQNTTITTNTALTDLNQGVGVTSGSFTITDSAGEKSAINITTQSLTTVGDLINAVNNLGIGVTASIKDDGTGIAIVDTAGGSETLTITDVGSANAAGALGIAGTATTQTVNGSSVSALVGPNSTLASTDSTGLVLTLKELSDSPITISVEEDPDATINAVSTFVDQYNLLVDKIDSLTFFDSEADEIGLLFGSTESLRIQNGYSRLLSGQIAAAGDHSTLGEVGIRINDKGKLELNRTKLKDAITADAGAVEAFFATDDTGLADRLNTLADLYAGADSSTLVNKSQTLTLQITRNNDRITSLNARLENERTRLLNTYYSMEEAIAKIQTNQSFISNIKPVTATSTS